MSCPPAFERSLFYYLKNGVPRQRNDRQSEAQTTKCQDLHKLFPFLQIKQCCQQEKYRSGDEYDPVLEHD